MKKSLQQIAFGLAIIAASAGVTLAMAKPDIPIEKVSTENPATKSIMRVTRPLKQPTTPQLVESYASLGVDLSKVFVIDGESIIRGIIPETQQALFMAMLSDPKLATVKFNEFLDNSYFHENHSKEWFEAQEVNLRKFLIEHSGLTKELIDSLTGISMLSFGIHSDHKSHNAIDRFWNIQIEKVVLLKELGLATDETVLNMRNIQPFVHTYLDEYISDCQKKPNEYREKLRMTANSAIVEDSTYHEAIVSFLAAFESKKIKNPKFKAIFGTAERFGTGVINEDFFIVHLCRYDETISTIGYTMPFLLKKGNPEPGALNVYEYPNSYRYATFHELGHITTHLLLEEHFPNERIAQGSIPLDQDIPDFQTLDIPTLAKNLLFRQSFFESNIDTFAEMMLPPELLAEKEEVEKAKKLILQQSKLFQHHLWTDRLELFQISGLYFYNGLVVVNNLSDFNYAISNKVPLRWWHQTPHPEEIRGNILNQFRITPSENLVGGLFYFHEANYKSYKESLLANQI